MTNSHPYTEYQQHVYWATIFAITMGSMCASSLIILSYIIFPAARNTGNRIIVYLSIADLGMSFSGPVSAYYLFGTSLSKLNGSGICIAQAAVVHYFCLASISWLGGIAFSNYLLIVHKKSLSSKLEIFFHLACWGLPLLPDLAALFENWLGSYHMLWCAYGESHHMEQIISTSLFSVPVMCLIGYCYRAIMAQIKRNRAMVSKSFQMNKAFNTDVKAYRRMTGFIIVYSVTWFPFFTMFLIEYLIQKPPPYQIQVVVTALAYSQGMSNFFLYFLNKQMRTIIREKLEMRIFIHLRSGSSTNSPETILSTF
eukprot:Phypoly_transcript_14413.p1 GENE.Phypoly_transcript_14413~~Phypoly_transcript_14413.p1  ORF type:complete len:329 (+),score=5.82 Phypoly_transcript_14413:56-988(+)